MGLLEFGEAFLWFCLAVGIGTVGAGLASLGMALNYFRGTKGGRTPLVCAILSGVAALLVWLVVAHADPPVGLIIAGISTVFTLTAIVSWINRSDRS